MHERRVRPRVWSETNQNHWWVRWLFCAACARTIATCQTPVELRNSSVLPRRVPSHSTCPPAGTHRRPQSTASPVDTNSLKSTDNPKTCAAKSVAAHAGNGRNSVQTAEMNLHQQSQVPIKTAPCSCMQEADSVQNSGSGTRTPDTRIMIPLL